MIGPGAGARVMVATRPVDFRKGPDALAALVGAEYGGDPYSGVIYVFRAKRSDRIKLVWWDGTGLCLMAKKLESGGFKWPGIQDGVMRLTAAQLGRFAGGSGLAPGAWRTPPDCPADCRLTGLSPLIHCLPCSWKRTFPTTLKRCVRWSSNRPASSMYSRFSGPRSNG
jgi:transposase